MIQVKLIRTKDTGKEATGTLSFTTLSGEKFSCVTLERPWLNNQHMISCIPAGTYKVKWGYMANHNVNHFLLQDVPGRTGIFIHSAAYVTDLEGCIALGESYSDFNKDGVPDIVNSRISIAKFELLLDKQDFELVITDALPA